MPRLKDRTKDHTTASDPQRPDQAQNASSGGVALDTLLIGGSHFRFSAARIRDLGASEYTLATIVVDSSGSVEPFRRQIEQALATVVGCCRSSPRADNLMLRVVFFDSAVVERHGFRPLPDCSEQDYRGRVRAQGTTALYDATYSAIQATTQYARTLAGSGFQVNAALFVVTDGADNASSVTRQMVAEAMRQARTAESLESILPVLIGIGVGTDQGGLGQWLEAFRTEAGFRQVVAIEKADEQTLARLAGFIAQSMSAQSQALGSGGPSRALTF